jgi:hypothetical protein
LKSSQKVDLNLSYFESSSNLVWKNIQKFRFHSHFLDSNLKNNSYFYLQPKSVSAQSP